MSYICRNRNLNAIVMKKSFLFLADGFEETEAIGTLDVLRRGGMEVQTVAVMGKQEVKGAHGVIIKADVLLREMLKEEGELLVFPGGMPGAQNLSECGELMGYLQEHFARQGTVAAICAAPALVLGKLPLKKDLRMTCYPGFENDLPEVNVLDKGVVVDGNVITGRGPGYSFAFGLAIVEHLCGKEKADEVAAGMLL